MATKTYYLVRHAEKQSPGDPDTPISAAGRKRAIALKDILLTKNITNIIVSKFIRTQQTALPLKDTIHVSLTMMDKDDHATIIQRLEHFPNSLVVGHTDNIPALIKEVTGKIVTIPEDDFDNLFIITIKNSVGVEIKKLKKTTYGPPSP